MNHIITNVIATVFGVAGALLLAANCPQSKWGYVAFSISTVATIIIQSKVASQRALLLLSCFFLAINVFGIYNWFI